MCRAGMLLPTCAMPGFGPLKATENAVCEGGRVGTCLEQLHYASGQRRERWWAG